MSQQPYYEITQWLKIIISFFLLVCGMMVGNCQAQEHGLRWSKWSEGYHDTGSGLMIDKVAGSYIDSVGNTYIFGHCGTDARLGENGPYICPIDSMPGYPRGDGRGVYLAKIDTAGNIIWCKCARGCFYAGCYQRNMVVKNNKITIAFDFLWSKGYNNWFYFFRHNAHSPYAHY